MSNLEILYSTKYEHNLQHAISLYVIIYYVHVIQRKQIESEPSDPHKEHIYKNIS